MTDRRPMDVKIVLTGIILLSIVALALLLVFVRMRDADAATMVRTTRYRCDHVPGLNTEWAGDDDVLIRGPKGNFRCATLDSLLPRLVTGTYPDGHIVYGSNDVTTDDGGTGGEG